MGNPVDVMSSAPSPPRSFDDVRAMVRDLPAADPAARKAALERESRLTKPEGALGRLEEVAAWLSAWQGRHPPTLVHAQALVFAGNHGVTAQGISAYPAEVTAQMVANFAAGGAAINQLARTYGAELGVIPLDLERPTADFTTAPAMSEDECMRAFAAGHEAVRNDADIVLLGEMGIGNTTAAAALCRSIFGGASADWAGPGTGLDDDGVARKAAVIDRAFDLHAAEAVDSLHALRRVGGRELAAIAGAVLAARQARLPVILDGFVATAAAAVLHGLDGGALDHCIAGHVSAEPGHARLLAALGKEPLLSLGMRLGEGSGAAVALGVVRGAVAAHTGMATFEEAGVSDRE